MTSVFCWYLGLFDCFGSLRPCKNRIDGFKLEWARKKNAFYLGYGGFPPALVIKDRKKICMIHPINLKRVPLKRGSDSRLTPLFQNLSLNQFYLQPTPSCLPYDSKGQTVWSPNLNKELAGCQEDLEQWPGSGIIPSYTIFRFYEKLESVHKDVLIPPGETQTDMRTFFKASQETTQPSPPRPLGFLKAIGVSIISDESVTRLAAWD